MYANLSICIWLLGAGDFRDQTGAAYRCYVKQADRGNLRCPVSSYNIFNVTPVVWCLFMEKGFTVRPRG